MTSNLLRARPSQRARASYSTAGARYRASPEAKLPTPDRRWFARSFEALALATFVVLFFIVPEGADPWVLVANLVAFYALFLRAFAAPDRILARLPSYFSIEVLFLAFGYLIFYYQYQLFLLGAADLSNSAYFKNPYMEGSNKAITLATVGMLAFTIGYRILGQATRDVAADGDQSSNGRNEHKNTPPRYFHDLAIASSALLLALVALYLLAGWRSANEGRYTGTTTQSLGLEGVFMLILTFCMIVAALWIYALAAEIRKPPMLVVGLLVTVGWSLRMLAFGNRTYFMLIALVLVGGYFTFVRRAPLLLLAAASGLWLFVYRIIEVIRFVPNWYESGNFWALMSSSPTYEQSSTESSFTVTTAGLRATVEMFPDTYGFTYGLFKLVQFAAIVPFSGKFYGPYVDPAYTASHEMLRDIMVSPWSTWDPGTNIVSDPYIDFGVPGVVVLLFLIGLLAKAIRNSVARDPYDPHRVVTYLVSMALFAVLPRFGTDFPLRILAWGFIFTLLVRAISSRLRSKPPDPQIAGKVDDRPNLARR